MRRALTVLLIVAATVVAAWWLMPRPALAIEIDPDGQAWVRSRTGRTALPDTVRVASRRNARVRIENHDTELHRLGLFAVPAGGTAEYTLPRPGTYSGVCSTHESSGSVTYVVE